MSYCSGLPVLESDSGILVEACLASLRQSAGLDDESVLPPLPSVVPVPAATIAPPPSGTSVAVGPSALATHVDHVVALDIALGAPRPAARTLARHLRWPIFLCAFLGGTFGGVALMKSPIAKTPIAQNAARHAAGALRAVTGD